MSPASASTICVLSPGARDSATDSSSNDNAGGSHGQVVDHLLPVAVGHVDTAPVSRKGLVELRSRARAGLDERVALAALGSVQAGDARRIARLAVGCLRGPARRAEEQEDEERARR